MTPPFHLVGGGESPCLQPRLQVVIASIVKQSQSNFLPGLPDTPSAGTPRNAPLDCKRKKDVPIYLNGENMYIKLEILYAFNIS